MGPMRTRKRSEQGYNLIEVIVAMAILASVILSVFALFVFGSRNVYSGKQQSQANAIGLRAMEDVNQLSKHSIYGAFGIDPATATLGTVDIHPGKSVYKDTYQNAILRSTTDITEEKDVNGFLQRWRDEYVARNALGQGAVHLVIIPVTRNTVSGSVVESPDPNGEIIRLRVIVTWAEGLRTRNAIFDTVKYDL
jgi:prepilin-type N-terminal cleavage/methylation domain-containing protein